MYGTAITTFYKQIISKLELKRLIVASIMAHVIMDVLSLICVEKSIFFHAEFVSMNIFCSYQPRLFNE